MDLGDDSLDEWDDKEAEAEWVRYQEQRRRQEAEATRFRAASENCTSVLPEDDIASFYLRPTVWRRPGPSPLGKSDGDESHQILYAKTCKIHRIARDHGNRVDRVHGARVLLRARAHAW
ncbi:hypothetical protein BV20DRAFT_973049 [Pilatotrama ljubarskyi]|nr:hypothetical protein BV20DRAFT_973049 [Pilatotrama ljubarskyi]